MITLADYQRALMQSLLDPTQVSEQLQTVIADSKNLSQRLAVYQNSILGGRVAVLRQIFACVEKLVGADYFQQMAEQFLQASPSTHVAIAAMGEGFVNYVAQHDVVQHVAYIADMAQLDWRWYQVFHGSSNAAIEADAGKSTLAGQWRLALDAQLLNSCFPLHHLWEMCQPEYQGEFQLSDEPGEYYFVLVQREQALRIESITAEQWRLLHQVSGAADPASEVILQQLYQRGCIIRA